MRTLLLAGGVLLLLLTLSSCGDEEVISTPTAEYQLGKNRYTTEVDGDSREYYVHVPAGYDSTRPIPLVMMLHGTSGDGERFYNISGWKEVGEEDTILTVYPSSWHYCIVEDGNQSNTTKWNCFPGAFDYCAGEVPRDDVKFLRQVVSEMEDRFNVDEKRIYLVGFSNGGQMAFRCAVEMSDIFAAVVENAASVSTDTTATPKRNIPVTFQLGNEDDRYFSSPAPLSGFAAGLQNFEVFRRIVHSHTSTFGYDTTATMSGDTSTAMIATYQPLPSTDNRMLNMVLVNGLGHAYPNGTNHWMHGAVLHWDWLKQYSSP